MGKKLPESVRRKLMDRREELMGGGIVIDNKNFSKMTVRILPPHEGELPGMRYRQFYCGQFAKGKQSTASPDSYGVRCPVLEFLDDVRKNGTTEDRNFVFGFVRTNTEYWLPVLDLRDMGTPENVNVRILRAKQTVYTQIINMMVDEDEGEDITDLYEGRPILIKKVGSGINTEWTASTVRDSGPITDDKAMMKAIEKASASFDVVNHFYSVDWNVLEAIYSGLSGEPIPDQYHELRDQIREKVSDEERPSKRTSHEDEGDEEAPKSSKISRPISKKKVEDAPEEEESEIEPEEEAAEEVSKAEEPEEAEESEPEEVEETPKAKKPVATGSDSIKVGTKVSFDTEDGKVNGVIANGTPKTVDGDVYYIVKDDKGVPWEVAQTELIVASASAPSKIRKVVKAEPEPEPEPEEEESEAEESEEPEEEDAPKGQRRIVKRTEMPIRSTTKVSSKLRRRLGK